MMKRWQAEIADVPTQDRIDVVQQFMNERSQCCPEYSQLVYINMLEKEDSQFREWLACYTSSSVKGRFSSEMKLLRDKSAEMIIDLCQKKNYKVETIHLALNVFDRVLLSDLI